MAYQDVSSDSMNFVTLEQLLGDYKITIDSDDYAANASDVALRNFALRGIREFGFDVTSRIKSLKLPIDSTNNTVALPDDFVDIVKIGVVTDDGFVRTLGQNKHLNQSRKYEVDSNGTATNETFDSEEGPLNIEANSIKDRQDDKSVTDGSNENYDYYIFENYLYQGGLGRLYGLGGGARVGDYRINYDQNRIEVDTNSNANEVVIEYVADEARSTNPVIHVYAEEALRCYIYYKICERKSTVPANEKARARAEYYNERRKAKARLSNFTKDEALRTIRKNYRLAPKY